MTKTVFRVLGVVASLAVGGAAVAADSPAIEWKVSDGGNGHWYRLLYVSPSESAETHFLLAQTVGGHTATITSTAENNFCFPIAQQTLGGVLIGVRKQVGNNQGAWITGEPWVYTNWHSGEGGNSWERYGEFNFTWNGEWQDTNLTPMPFSLVEFEADCNGDGIVDYGQIQRGELADTNNNGVPDVCELVITSVKPVSGASTGGTAVRINGNNFPISPIVTFGGVAATEIVRVSPSLITAVTPAGTPGMTVVTVNSASSESFYYRPSCDGDLDNNGTIDSSDLGLMLVNYGNCYESAVPEPQQQEPFILQSVETPSPLLLNKK